MSPDWWEPFVARLATLGDLEHGVLKAGLVGPGIERIRLTFGEGEWWEASLQEVGNREEAERAPTTSQMRRIFRRMVEADWVGMLREVTEELQADYERDAACQLLWMADDLMEGVGVLPTRREDFGSPFYDVLRWATHACTKQDGDLEHSLLDAVDTPNMGRTALLGVLRYLEEEPEFEVDMWPICNCNFYAS